MGMIGWTEEAGRSVEGVLSVGKGLEGGGF